MWSLTKVVMISSTWSCLLLKRLACNATLQLLRIWPRVCLSPHNLHLSERLWSFLHSARLALCGSVSWAALRANLNSGDERSWMALDQAVDAISSTSLNNWPCTFRATECFRRFSVCCLVSASLARATVVFLDAPGASEKLTCAEVKGLNATCLLTLSFPRASLAMWLAHPSREVSSRQAFPTWSLLVSAWGKVQASGCWWEEKSGWVSRSCQTRPSL